MFWNLFDLHQEWLFIRTWKPRSNMFWVGKAIVILQLYVQFYVWLYICCFWYILLFIVFFWIRVTSCDEVKLLIPSYFQVVAYCFQCIYIYIGWCVFQLLCDYFISVLFVIQVQLYSHVVSVIYLSCHAWENQVYWSL